MIVLDALQEIYGASILLQPRLRSERLSFCKKIIKMDYLKSFTMGSIKN
jgi:hypothetical protein